MLLLEAKLMLQVSQRGRGVPLSGELVDKMSTEIVVETSTGIVLEGCEISSQAWAGSGMGDWGRLWALNRP